MIMTMVMMIMTMIMTEGLFKALVTFLSFVLLGVTMPILDEKRDVQCSDFNADLLLPFPDLLLFRESI